MRQPAVRRGAGGTHHRSCVATSCSHPDSPSLCLRHQVFDHLMDSPAAAQDAEKLRHFLDLVAVRVVSGDCCPEHTHDSCFQHCVTLLLPVCIPLQEVELTKLEALQLMNSKPKTLVELHTLVEQVNTRLTEEEQEDLLQLCRTVL
jgi:hypothetical protein